MTITIIARLTFREASRRKILWAALLLGVLFLVVYGLGLHFMQVDIQDPRNRVSPIAQREIYNFMLMAGMYAVNFLTIAMSVLTSIGTLSSEVASGTIQTLATKPVRRLEILLGKWLGFVVMLSLYLILMAGGTMAVVYTITGYTAPNALRGLALLWMNAMLLLSVSLFGGSFMSTLANGVLAFGLYGVAFVGGWVEQIGSFLNNQVAVNIGILSSLIIPSEALWKRAAYEMQSPLAGAMGFSPFSSASTPSGLMVAYAALYIIAMLGLAIRLFNRRDL
ncbi:MAG: ABC transporter permease [Anaerolineales bacterium]|jgi:ABC-type transport system involved in multi-copper enzyme maturation permease subunit